MPTININSLLQNEQAILQESLSIAYQHDEEMTKEQLKKILSDLNEDKVRINVTI
jgi:molybdopterin synthase catalytic subunit